MVVRRTRGGIADDVVHGPTEASVDGVYAIASRSDWRSSAASRCGRSSCIALCGLVLASCRFSRRGEWTKHPPLLRDRRCDDTLLAVTSFFSSVPVDSFPTPCSPIPRPRLRPLAAVLYSGSFFVISIFLGSVALRPAKGRLLAADYDREAWSRVHGGNFGPFVYGATLLRLGGYSQSDVNMLTPFSLATVEHETK